MKRKKFEAAAMAAILAAMSLNGSLIHVSAAENNGSEDDFANQIAAEFSQPEMKYKPYARWWLAEGSHTDETLRESVQELYDDGYGGIEFVTLDESQYLDKETYAWGSPEWIHDTKVIIEECNRLGMSVSMTSGTHWSTANLISITPDEEAASQELGYTVLSVQGKSGEGKEADSAENDTEGNGQSSADAGEKTTYDGYLPYCKLPANVTKQTLVKVIAAKVTERGSDPEELNQTPSKIDMSSLKDVTEMAVDDNGDGIYGIHFTAEDDGDYDLFTFYQYGTGESYSPAVSPSYTINYLSEAGAAALIDYWDTNVLTEDVQELIDGIDECDMYMDSLELSAHGQNTTGHLWCADMEEQFTKRQGYSIDEMLPLLILTSGRSGCFGEPLAYRYEPDNEEDVQYVENLRRDFCQTQTELYTENCLGTLSDWLHSKNMKLRAENSYGMRFEISEPAAALDYIETESMEFANELDSHRGMAGAAHLFNKRMSSETGAWVSRNYVYNNEYYRQIFYMQYAAGVQKTMTHGYSSEYGPEDRVQWPGYEGMGDEWSDRFSKRQPASEDYPELNAHLSRIQKAMEQGVPQMDLAILRTDYAYNNQLTPGGLMGFVQNGVYSNKAHNQDAYYWRDLELQNAGYTYDYFSPYLLTDESVTSENGLLNPDGAAYQAVILMEDELPYEAAQKLLQWAKDGLPVVFVNNASEIVANTDVTKDNTEAGSTTGSNDGNEEALEEIVKEMKELSNVKTVESESDAYEALQELGVSPRVEYKEANTKLLPVMRSAEDADYLYLYHYMYEDEENYEGEISLDGIYEPYVIDTWSGNVEKVQGVSYEDGRTVLHVDAAPGETMVFALKHGDDGENSVEQIEAENSGEGTRNEAKDIADTKSEVEKNVSKNAAGAKEKEGNEAVDELQEKSSINNVLTLSNWNLTIDSYEPGEKVTRTEENEDTGVTTTEAAYTTNHVEIDVGTLAELVSWKDIESVGETVSGIGTYTTTFELPDEWQIAENTEASEGDTESASSEAAKMNSGKIEFQADSFQGGTAAIWINDTKVPVNMDRRTADLTAYIQPGENTITVRVTSSLRNIMITQGYDGWIFGTPDPDDYGMTGETKLVYTK